MYHIGAFFDIMTLLIVFANISYTKIVHIFFQRKKLLKMIPFIIYLKTIKIRGGTIKTDMYPKIVPYRTHILA